MAVARHGRVDRDSEARTVSRWLSHALMMGLVLAVPAISALNLGAHRPVDRGVAFAFDSGRGTFSRSTRGYIVKPLVVPAAAALAPRRAPFVYTVKDGDVLGAIADANGLRIDTLRQTNNLADVDSLSIGQQLLIPPANGVMVRVAPGDTVKALSDRFHIEQQVIIEYNLVRDPANLAPGTLLMLPDGTDLTSPQASTVVANSSSGSDPGAIAFGHSSYNHFPWGQCTYWVASHRNIPWNGDAWSWFGSARASGWATGRTPKVGAIMVTWESRYYGHVAIVEAVYGDGSYLISEMNYRGLGIVDQRHIIPGQVPLIGFIY
jgi:surface antigen